MSTSFNQSSPKRGAKTPQFIAVPVFAISPQLFVGVASRTRGGRTCLKVGRVLQEHPQYRTQSVLLYSSSNPSCCIPTDSERVDTAGTNTYRMKKKRPTSRCAKASCRLRVSKDLGQARCVARAPAARRSLAGGITAIPQVFLVVKLDGMLLRRRVRIGPNRVRRLLAGNFHLTREHDFTSRWVELRTGK